jgi:hypothetical protein
MPDPKSEESRNIAYPLACPVRLFLASSSLDVTTTRASSEGFTFIASVPLEAGESIYCELTVRSAGTEPMILAGRAHVTRVDWQFQGGFEIACEFDDYLLVGQTSLPNR